MSYKLGRGTSVKAMTAAAVTSLSIASALVGANAAHAGSWMRATCVDPYGVAGSNEGWSSHAGAGFGYGSNNSVSCAPYMFGLLSTDAPAPVNAYQGIKYEPPEGSTLSGGDVGVDLLADGSGYNATGVAGVSSPGFEYNASNVIFQCAGGLGPCSGNTNHFVGTIGIPSNRGGNLYVVAACGGEQGAWCNAGGSEGAWSRVRVNWARLRLSSTQAPTATDFRGSLLAPGAHGTAGLSFAAAVSSGPGIYKVTVWIDDKAVYDTTPNRNTGKCVPVGTDLPTGALIFAYQQPCLRSQTVDVTVRTTGLRDGEHQLRVAVADAAQNAQTVLRRTIETNNRTTATSTLASDPPAPGSPGAAGGEPIYAIALDAETQRFSRGVRRSWHRSAITLSGTLLGIGGIPAPGVPVSLLARNAGDDQAAVVARTTTDAAGHWSVTAPQGPSRRLTITYGAEARPSVPGVVTIRQTVTPALSMRVATLGRGRLRFRGRLTVRPLGSPRPLVLIEARRGRRWQTVGRPVRVDASGAYRLIYDGGRAVVGGSYAFRATAPATYLFGRGVSPIRRTVVR